MSLPGWWVTRHIALLLISGGLPHGSPDHAGFISGKKERLTHKTLFLVALTSAHHISELHAFLPFLNEKTLNLSIWKRASIKDEHAGVLGRRY